VLPVVTLNESDFALAVEANTSSLPVEVIGAKAELKAAGAATADDAGITPVEVVSSSFVANKYATVVRSAVTAGTKPVRRPEPTIVARATPAYCVATETKPVPSAAATTTASREVAVKVSPVPAADPSPSKYKVPDVVFGETSETEPERVSPESR